MGNESSLGFGHFSNADDEHLWRTYSYDGLESTRSAFISSDSSIRNLVESLQNNEYIKTIMEKDQEKK